MSTIPSPRPAWVARFPHPHWHLRRPLVGPDTMVR